MADIYNHHEIEEKWHKIATNRLKGEMANGQQSFLLI